MNQTQPTPSNLGPAFPRALLTPHPKNRRVPRSVALFNSRGPLQMWHRLKVAASASRLRKPGGPSRHFPFAQVTPPRFHFNNPRPPHRHGVLTQNRAFLTQSAFSAQKQKMIR